ncbi:phosphoenolpyruvate-protein phosphotransferase, partial [human gut metagenome]
HDISDRLVSILSGRKQKSAKDFATGANKIICTEDFLPSEIIQFCENNAQGFLTAFGSSDSHSAILAKSLDIPVIVGLGWDLLNDIRTGDSLTVDGREGTVILNEKSESFVS